MQDEVATEFAVTKFSGNTFKVEQECLAETPKLSTAMGPLVKKRKNEKQGWQFKWIITDGEKISNRIPRRFETFLVCVLIEWYLVQLAVG
jgi:hypothetical protein